MAITLWAKSMRLVFEGRGYRVYEVDVGLLIDPVEVRGTCTVVPPPPARAEPYLTLGVICARSGYRAVILSPRTCCGECAFNLIANNLVGDVAIAVGYASLFLGEFQGKALIYRPRELNYESLKETVELDPYKRVGITWCLKHLAYGRRAVRPYAVVNSLVELKELLSSLQR